MSKKALYLDPVGMSVEDYLKAAGPTEFPEPHNLSKVAQTAIKRHSSIALDFLAADNENKGAVRDKLHRAMVTPYFNLQTGNKKQVMEETPLCTGYMIFLNARGSLAHIVHRADVDDPHYADALPHRREPIPRKWWGAHPDFIRREIIKTFLRRGMI